MENVKKRARFIMLIYVLTFLLGQSAYAQIEYISGVVNSYHAVSKSPGSIVKCGPVGSGSKLCLNSVTGLSVGDRVMVIQMRGAQVSAMGPFDPNYGWVFDYKRAGVSELATVKEINGSCITLKEFLFNDFDANGDVQVVRVKTGNILATNGDVTCAPWNGSTGGVVAIECEVLVVNHKIDVSYMGFRGGAIYNGQMQCNRMEYEFLYGSPWGAAKGEGIASTSAWGSAIDNHGAGYGNYANAGGGGNSVNAGGGGGANATAGGDGGNEWEGCAPALIPSANGGRGGRVLAAPGNRLFMGGGGGAGHGDGLKSTGGGNGGGIIMIIAKTSLANPYGTGQLLLRGQNAVNTDHDGAGGGGAGGTLYICTPLYYNSPALQRFTVDLSGGKGGSTLAPWGNNHGPGGGGSGGRLFTSTLIRNAAFPVALGVIAAAGTPGNTHPPLNWGAKAGGNIVFTNIDCGNTWLNPVRQGIAACAQTDTIRITTCDPRVTLTVANVHPNMRNFEWYTPDNPNNQQIDNYASKTFPSRNGRYYAYQALNNGCRCLTVFEVTVIPRTVYYRDVTIKCGQSINLDTLDSCRFRTRFRYPWVDSTAGESILSSVVSPKRFNTYTSESFMDSTFTCLNCFTVVRVHVEYPVYEREVNACLHESISVGPSPNCGPAYYYHWRNPFNQEWFTFSDASTLVPADGGVYEITAYGTDGCLCITRIKINPDVPAQKIDTINILCGDSIDLYDYDSCKGFSYGWLDMAASTVLLSSKVAPSSSNTYLLDSYSDNTSSCLNCMMQLQVNVLARDTADTTVLGCFGDLIWLNPSNKCGQGVSWKWTLPNGMQLPWSSTPTLVVNAHQATYYVTTQLPNGCECVTRVHIEVNVPVVRSHTVVINCGDSIDLSIYDSCRAYNNGWSVPEDELYHLGPIVSPGHSTNYVLETFSDSLNICLTCITNVNVIVNPAPVIYDTLTACAGDTITLNACSGADNWAWHLPIGLTVYTTTSTISVIARDSAQTYWVEATLPNGCICVRYFTILPMQPQRIRTTVNIPCGSAVDLDTLLRCPQGTAVWMSLPDSTVVSSVVHPVSGSQYIGLSYDHAGSACIRCITDIIFNTFDSVVKTKTYAYGCSGGDGQWMTPDCQGSSHVWYDAVSGDIYATVNNPSGGVVVAPPFPRSFRVRTLMSNGCYCYTDVTVNDGRTLPTYKNYYTYINCSKVVDLDDYDSCSQGGGSSTGWTNPVTGDPVSGSILRVDKNETFKKVYLDSNGCEVCVVTISFIVSQPVYPVYFDTLVYNKCVGETLNPTPRCPQTTSLTRWYDDVDDTRNLVYGDNAPFIVQSNMNGYYSRYYYDSAGCIACVEAYNVKAYTPITNESSIPYIDVVICDSMQFCTVVPLPTGVFFENILPGQCTWTPAASSVSRYGLGSVLVCQPVTNNAVFTERCYSDNNCLMSVKKIRVIVADCKTSNGVPLDAGIVKEEVEKWVHVYPNPTSGRFYLEMAPAVNEIKLELTDMLGRQIMSIDKLKNVPNSRIELQLPQVAAGVYIMRLQFGSETVLTKLVVE